MFVIQDMSVVFFNILDFVYELIFFSLKKTLNKCFKMPSILWI